MTKRTTLKWFKWCFDQAYQMLGAHTGGPYEQQFRRNLKCSERAIKALGKQTNTTKQTK